MKEQENSLQSDENEDENSINCVRYNPPSRCDEQVYWYNAVKFLNDNSNSGWKEEVTILYEYSVYCNKPIRMLTPFMNMWDGHLGSIEEIMHRF